MRAQQPPNPQRAHGLNLHPRLFAGGTVATRVSKVALVTGAGRGIGAATAERLAQDGWDVIINYRNTAEGAETVATTVRAMGQRALIQKADVSRLDEVEAMIQNGVRELGGLDAVVNNAGVYKRSAFDKLDPADWHEALDVNLTGAYYVTRTALPHLREGSRIVNVASQIAQTGTLHGAHYAASKAGLVALTKSLALELASKGILVNAIAPGAIATDMIVETKEAREARSKRIPLGRVGEAAEIAGLVSFLLGPDSTYVTGQLLAANGGSRL